MYFGIGLSTWRKWHSKEEREKIEMALMCFNEIGYLKDLEILLIKFFGFAFKTYNHEVMWKHDSVQDEYDSEGEWWQGGCEYHTTLSHSLPHGLQAVWLALELHIVGNSIRMESAKTLRPNKRPVCSSQFKEQFRMGEIKLFLLCWSIHRGNKKFLNSRPAPGKMEKIPGRTWNIEKNSRSTWNIVKNSSRFQAYHTANNVITSNSNKSGFIIINKVSININNKMQWSVLTGGYCRVRNKFLI